MAVSWNIDYFKTQNASIHITELNKALWKHYTTTQQLTESWCGESGAQ